MKYGSLGTGDAQGRAGPVYLQQEEPSKFSSSNESKTVILPKTILKVGLAASVLFVGMYKIYSGHIATSATESVRYSQVSSADLLKISLNVYNSDYSTQVDLTAMSYPFLASGLLAEPQRSTTVEASIDDGFFRHCTYEIKLAVGGGPWDETPGVIAAKDFNPNGFLNRTDVEGKMTTTVTFPSPGAYDCTVSCETEDSSVTTSDLSEKIMVYYIRRELRHLHSSDRLDFLHCFEKMMNLAEEEGKMKYGPHFKSLEMFEIMHLDAAGTRATDHFHDGMGFTTQHMAMSSEFELSMQTIKPHISLPYWDYTIDGYNIKSASKITGRPDDERSLFIRSELFTAMWFGNTNSESNVVTEGPFAYQEIPRSYKNFTIRSPYGFLRAPWNINPNKYVTRYHKICGSKVDPDSNGNTSTLQWPTCNVHFEYTNTATYDDWYSWAMNIGYTPHGPVHSWIGGVGGMCDTAWDEMHKSGMISSTILTTLKFEAFVMLKNMWRFHIINAPKYCSPDTNVSQCMWICTEDHVIDQYVINYFVETMGINELDPNLGEIINRVLCETPFWPGDQLEAASPVDISFWPIHPTMERLLQYKDMVRPFVVSEWPEMDVSQPVCQYMSTSRCLGHNAYDLTKFSVTFYNATLGTYDKRVLTNQEVRSIINPTVDYAIPFVFDNFQWTHCEGNTSFKPLDLSQYKTSNSSLS